MMVRIEKTITTEISYDLDTMAEIFSNMSDQEQADFFIKVAEYGCAHFPGDPNDQWYFVGAHLRTCGCSTQEARDLVDALFRGMSAKTTAKAA